MDSKYRESGVDIDAANRTMKAVGGMIKETWSGNVLSDTGNFGGLFGLPEGYREPVLVSSVDGVGTKLKVAFLAGRHDTVGEDLVNHCVNDILVQGAKPLFFLDYIGCGSLNTEVAAGIIEGFARGCRRNGCSLIGGETAEMPGIYSKDEYDLAGCIVGIVERGEIIDGSAITPGDDLWAIPSSGLHTNGYSLARKIIFEDEKMTVEDLLPGMEVTVGQALLEIHRSYLREYEHISRDVRINGLAHITGGGLVENIPRVLPKGTSVEIDRGAWETPPLFRFLQERGGISEDEMYRVFNMGVGMVVIIPRGQRDKVGSIGKLNWPLIRIGKVVEGSGEVQLS